MHRTLLLYVFREMLKTFVLTAVGLTVILSMGGGALRILQLEGASAAQILQVLLVVIPMMATLSLPVAALYATAITFGRLSADNELTACKACGVNILWLMTPCVVLSLAVAGFTFYFSNFMIPSFYKQLEALLRKDIQQIVRRELTGSGSLSYQKKFILHVDSAAEFQPEIASDDVEYLSLTGCAFMQFERDQPARMGTARNVLVRFDKNVEQNTISAQLIDVRGFDITRDQFYSLDEQTIGPILPPLTFPLKPKWLNLSELNYYRHHTEELPAIKNLLIDCRRKIMRCLFHQQVTQSRQNLELVDGDRRVTIQAGQISSREFPVRMRENLKVIEVTPEYTREITADEAILELTGGGERAPARIEIMLVDNVRVIDSRQPDQPLEFPRQTIKPPLLVPASVIAETDAIPEQQILDVSQTLNICSPVDHAREALRRERVYYKYKIISEMHSRLALSLSVFPVVILGAALSIMVRGGHVMSAFGISFLPSLLVICIIRMGSNIAESEATVYLGIGIIWGSLVLLALLDLLMVFKFVRR